MDATPPALSSSRRRHSCAGSSTRPAPPPAFQLRRRNGWWWWSFEGSACVSPHVRCWASLSVARTSAKRVEGQRGLRQVSPRCSVEIYRKVCGEKQVVVKDSSVMMAERALQVEPTPPTTPTTATAHSTTTSHFGTTLKATVEEIYLVEILCQMF
ncbi:hypothetical protein E2C01_090399 [Portunus trituberculatus]|uniref:Uncharacterized protein n=1 Tax=Portunus trituberculatus TaxID=210409 RepID=A0A5B7JEL3_PORTR|nr:hypothetical protein [Portunus trituberculatus]